MQLAIYVSNNPIVTISMSVNLVQWSKYDIMPRKNAQFIRQHIPARPFLDYVTHADRCFGYSIMQGVKSIKRHIYMHENISSNFGVVGMLMQIEGYDMSFLYLLKVVITYEGRYGTMNRIGSTFGI